jgi:tripartite-type tricarboxylate transporter receptor subunit TctC
MFDDMMDVTRPYYAGPNMKPERVKQFIEAARKIPTDPEWIAEMSKLDGSSVEFVQHEDTVKIMNKIISTDKKILDLIK